MKRTLYDNVSKNYDISRRAGKKTVELLVELLSPISDVSILDVGCGTGNFLLELNGLSKLLVGLDISAGMLAQAKSKISRATLIRGSVLFMPFCEAAFDAAYCVQVLHHISDKSRFMSEVYRILIHTCPFEVVFRNRKEPESFLDKRYRDGWSVFSLMNPQEIEEGCKRIKDDLQSGKAANIVTKFNRTAEQMGGRVSFIRSVKS